MSNIDNVVGIVGATIGIGQYIVNDYIITIAATEGDYGYTMTITRGTETQTVTLYGLTSEQYNLMLAYLEQAQTAAQTSASSANTAITARNAAQSARNAAQSARDDAQSASETSTQAANAAITARNSSYTYMNNAQTAANTANSARSGADAARSAAVSAKTAAESAATRAETAAGQITGMTAEAETLEPGSPATASFQDGVLSLGIPRGATGSQGPQGEDGPPGTPGVSPTVTVTDIPGGHRVTITDSTGAHSFDVMDGSGGGAVDDVQVNGVSVVSGGVANVPTGTNNVYGVVKGAESRGINIVNGIPEIRQATHTLIKEGTSGYIPICPQRQHVSTFYGLAKAAGDTTQSQSSNAVGQYTESAKSAIQVMLGIAGIIGNVEGTTASQAYSVGDAFLYGGALYKATASIAANDAIVPGTNCEQTTLIDLMKGA